MTRWQRPVRLFLGLFVIVFAVVVYFSISERQKQAPLTTVPRTDPDAVVESTGGEVILFKGSQQDIRIQSERRVTYQSGRTKFTNAKIDVLARGGRNFTITAAEADVAENQSQIDMRGNVVVTASDGLTVKANEATYTQSDEMMRAPGPVSFARERMTGTSVGATYDQSRDVLWLLDQAHIVVTPDDKGAGGADVTAGAAGYARRDRYLRFERGVKMLRGTQGLEANGAVAYLRADRDQVETLELRGNSRVVGVGNNVPNSLQAMTSRDMNLAYAEDGSTLQRATLAGDGVVQLAAANGQPGQRLSAQAIDIQLAPDGVTLTVLNAQNRVQLDLPATPDAPARQIRSAVLESASEPGQVGLSRAKFSEQVEFRETRPATQTDAAVDRVVRSRLLDAKVRDGLSAIDQAVFTEGVTVKDADMDASGPQMTYDVAKGALALTGPNIPGRPSTRVVDARATIEAQKIDWTLDGTKLVAEGDVKSVLKSGSSTPAANGGKPAAGGAQRDTKRPGILAADEPTNVTAKSLLYNSKTGRADYNGEARLWQVDTSIRGDTIAIDDATGNLAAAGAVRTEMRLKETDKAKGDAAGAKKPAPKPAAATTADPRGNLTIATADSMLYEDARRLATYTSNARVRSDDSDLKADRIEMFLDESGRGLERLEAYEKVSLKDPTKFGKGDRLTYFSADERYVMSNTTGPLVKVIEQLPGECRETTGRTLTFFRATDSITVDGKEESRTQTKTGGKCPEPLP